MRFNQSVRKDNPKTFIFKLGVYALFILVAFPAKAQFFAGINAGPALGKTVDGFFMLHPKNQEWLSFNLSAGYTVPGPFLLSFLSNDCLTQHKNSGYHVRFGFRNSLVGGAQNPTMAHHQNHLFWGLNVVGSQYKENANNDGCNPDEPLGLVERSQLLVGGAVQAGYAWNLVPFTRDNNLFLDLGIQIGFPFNPKNGFLGTFNYIPGLGYGFPGKTGNGVNFEFIAVLRYELYHAKYGYNKVKKFKR